MTHHNADELAGRKLLPCPFCGSPGEIVKNGFPPRNPWRHPSCTNTKCVAHNEEQDEQGGTHIDRKTDAEAIALWNTRHPQQPQGGVVSEAIARRALLEISVACEARAHAGGRVAISELHLSDMNAIAEKCKTTLAALPSPVGEDDARKHRKNERPAIWTYSEEDFKAIGAHLYYFAPANAAPSPYRTQREVKAIIDIADDGTLAGVELIDNMPAPPVSPVAQSELSALGKQYLKRRVEVLSDTIAREEFRHEDGEAAKREYWIGRLQEAKITLSNLSQKLEARKDGFGSVSSLTASQSPEGKP